MHLLTIAVFQMTIKHYLYLKIPHNLSELQKHGYLIYTLYTDKHCKSAYQYCFRLM